MAGRKAGSKSAGYHSNLSIPGYQPKTPTKAPPPSEAATSPAGDYAGAQKQYERSVAALPPAAQAVTESATRAAEHAERAALRAQRAEARQQRVINKYVTKAFEKPKQPGQKPSSPFSLPSVTQHIEHAKVDVAKVRESLLSHPQVKQANAEGKVVGLKGLRQIRQSTAEANALKPAHGLTHSKKYGVGAAGISQTPAQLRHLEAIQGVPQGTQGRRMATIMEKKHEESEPSTLEDLSYASIGIPGIGVGGDLAKLSELGLKAIPEIASREGASALATKAGAKAAESAASAAAKTKALPAEILRGAKGLPSFAKESPQLARAGAKALPGAAKAAAKGAPAAIGRGALRGAENTYQATGVLGALGAAHKAGINLPGGAILEGQGRALEKDPLKVASSTANLAPGLLVSAFQLPVAAGKSAVEGSAAPLEGAVNEQINFAKHFAKTYGSSDPKVIEKATFKEGLLPEVLAGPFLAKAGKEVGGRLRDSAVERSVARKSPLTDEHGNVAVDKYGIPVKKGQLRHPNQTHLSRELENAHLRREEARHAGKTEDLVNVEAGRRMHAVEAAAHKAAGSKVTVRKGLGPKGKDELIARAPDFIPFLNRAAIDLHNPDAALREIQHYADMWKQGKSAAELGADPSKLNARDAVDFFLAHPDALKNKHLASMLDSYRSMANGKEGLASLSTSDRNRYLGVMVAHGIKTPEERIPVGARQFTDATDRAGAWEDVKARDKAIAELGKRAREKKIEARAHDSKSPKGRQLRREYKALYAKAKGLKAERDVLHSELNPYTRPGAKPNRNAKRTAYDEALEKEAVGETQALLKERDLHPEPAYVPDTSAVARSVPDQTATGGEKQPKGPQINEGYVWKHGLQVQGYEHLQNSVHRAVAAHHWFENGRRFREQHAIPYKGIVQHSGKDWAMAAQHGVINPRDVALVPTQVTKRYERAMQGGTPSDYKTAADALSAEARSANDLVPGTKYEAYPKAAWEEFSAQAQSAPVSQLLRKANMVTSRAMLSTPSFVAAQVVAETAQALAEGNPARLAQGLYRYSKLSPEQRARVSGVSGETGHAIFSADRLGNALADEGKPMKDALSFFRRNLFGRSAKSIVSLKWAGEVNRATSGLTRRAVLTGEVMRDVNSLHARGRKLLSLQTEIQKELSKATKGLRGKAKTDAAMKWVADHPKALDHYEKGLHGAMGGWNNLTRTGRVPEVYRAAGLMFYPFLRMSVLWPLKYAINHPIKATALAYLTAENNFALREALHGEPSFLNYAQIPLYGEVNGKVGPTDTMNLSRVSPGGNAIVSAIQGSGSPLGAVQPWLAAGVTGATGAGPLGPVEGGPGAALKAAGASILSLSPYVRAADTLAGQKAGGESEFGILAKRANLAVEPLSALEAKLKGSTRSQLTRSLGNPLQTTPIGLARDQAKLGRVLQTLSDNSSSNRDKILGATAKEQRQIASMEEKSEKAKGELEGLYRKYGVQGAQKADEKVWKYAHPFGGWNQKKETGGYSSSGYEGSGYEGSGYGGSGGGQQFKNLKVPHEANGVGINLSIPGFSGLTGAIGSILGGTPAQAAELPKGAKAKPSKQSKQPVRLPFLETPEQQKIAKTVLNVGTKLGASRKEKLAAIETGLQETGFKNLRPYENSFGEDTAGWREELAPYYTGRLNVGKSARAFFDEAKSDPSIPGGGGETPGELAQTIQGSAFGGEETYGRHLGEAKSILRAYNHGPINADLSKQGKKVFVRADAKGMVQWVKNAEGVQEGSPRQAHWAGAEGLSASQPWCANFVSNGLARRGVPLPPNPNYVPSYETEWTGGRNIGTNLAKAKPGDLIAFSGQHIGVYVGNGEMISGNFGNQVARAKVSEGPAAVSAILRPNYKGGKVAVKAGTALPGSAFGVTGGVPAPAAASIPGFPTGNESSTTGGKTKQAKGTSKLNRLRLVEQISAGNLQGLGIPGFTPQKGPDLASIGKAVEEARRKLLAA